MRREQLKQKTNTPRTGTINTKPQTKKPSRMRREQPNHKQKRTKKNKKPQIKNI